MEYNIFRKFSTRCTSPRPRAIQCRSQKYQREHPVPLCFRSGTCLVAFPRSTRSKRREVRDGGKAWR